MTDIKQELDKIKRRISDAAFLANKGLSNEVGIHVFTYAPEHELVVRDSAMARGSLLIKTGIINAASKIRAA